MQSTRLNCPVLTAVSTRDPGRFVICHVRDLSISTKRYQFDYALRWTKLRSVVSTAATVAKSFVREDDATSVSWPVVNLGEECPTAVIIFLLLLNCGGVFIERDNELENGFQFRFKNISLR